MITVHHDINDSALKSEVTTTSSGVGLLFENGTGNYCNVREMQQGEGKGYIREEEVREGAVAGMCFMVC